jgi:hypothetical protein
MDMQSVWIAYFWSQIVLTYLIIPIMQSYYASGEHTTVKRAYNALKLNIKYALIMSLVLIIIVIIQSATVGMSINGLMTLMAIISITGGTVAITFLLGYGLQAVPKKIWYKSYNDNTIALLHCMLFKISSDLDVVKDAVANSYNDLVVRLSSHPDFELLKNRFEKINIIDLQITDSSYSALSDGGNPSAVVNKLISDYQYLNEEVDNIVLKISTRQSKPIAGVKMYLYRTASIFLGIVGLIIVIGEITIVSPINLFAFSPSHDSSNSTVGQTIQFIALFFITTYISYVTFYPSFNTMISGIYYIHNNVCNVQSLFLHSKILLQLSVPLAYNFMRLLRINDSSLGKFIGPVPHNYIDWIPIFVLLVWIVFLFDIRNRILPYFNIDQFNQLVDIGDADINYRAASGRAIYRQSIDRRSAVGQSIDRRSAVGQMDEI